MALEVFGDNPSATITSGGTTAPAAGTPESWTASVLAKFPDANASSGAQFHIADVNPNLAYELMTVTAGAGGTGTRTWAVTRGAEGTTPVAHKAGFTVQQVASAGGLGSMVQSFNAAAYGAVGDGTTDSTAALTNWINDINAANAGFAFLPPGQYIVTSPLPALTTPAVRVLGTGWAQSAYTQGATITAGTGFSGTLFTMAGEGQELYGITLDGNNLASTILAVTAVNCRFISSSIHGCNNSGAGGLGGGVGVDVQSGGTSFWMSNCRLNAVASKATALRINDTDAIIIGNKPLNAGICVEVLGGGAGALIQGNHWTNGSSGQTAVWVQAGSNLNISGNRFDANVKAGVQITGASSIVNITIANNTFHSSVWTDNTYACVAVDTANGGVSGLNITGNANYNGASNHRAAYFLAAMTQSGSAASSPGNIASYGCLCSSNIAWVGTSFYGPSATPTVGGGRANLVSTTGAPGSYSNPGDV